jgi:hypothetical protein
MQKQGKRTSSTEDAIWGRLVGQTIESLTPAAARSILRLEFPEGDRLRMRELAEKARNGTLTRAEQEEIETYSRVGSVLGIFKSKARVALRRSAKTNGAGL